VALGVGACGDQAAMGLAYQQVMGPWAATFTGASGSSISNSQVSAGAGFSW
jgi:hypothetical protein